MRLNKSFVIAIVSIFITIFFISSVSHAIPAFARRYKISCTTCHAPIPKLKPYGDEFAGNGFIMKENEKERDYISEGDDLLWLNRTFPIGIRFDSYAVYDQDKTVDKDLQTPWGVKLLSGGTLYKNIGYYFYFYLSEAGEIAGIEDAYIHFDNVGGSNLDILVGQFQTCDPLMKRELRLTYEDYMIYKQHVGESVTNLTYDRGFTFVYGVEKTGTDIVAMLVNGNGKGEAKDDKYDNDNFKNIGLRINQGIGELLSIGGFYYTGKERMNYFGLPSQDNEITYYGPDVNFNYKQIGFTGQYLIRKDTNPYFFSGNPAEVETKGIVAEIVISPQLDRSRYYITALYNKVESDNEYDDYKYQTATLSGTYLLARNLRLVGEYTRDMENDLNKFTVGMVSGF